MNVHIYLHMFVSLVFFIYYAILLYAVPVLASGRIAHLCLVPYQRRHFMFYCTKRREKL